MWVIRAIRSAAQAPTIVVARDGDLVIGHPRVGNICTEIRSPGTENHEGGDRYFKFKYLVENKCLLGSTVQYST